MVNTSDSGFALAGVTGSDDGDVSGYHPAKDSTQGRIRDIWVLKFNSTGILQWQKCLGGSGEDIGYSIVETTDGGYAITGTTASNDGDLTGNHDNTNTALWVVKLKGPNNGVETDLFSSSSLPFQNFNLYPNPASDEIHLYSYHSALIKQMKFYDLLGVQFYPEYQIENTSATVDVHNLPTGSYIVRINYCGEGKLNIEEVQKFMHYRN